MKKIILILILTQLLFSNDSDKIFDYVKNNNKDLIKEYLKKIENINIRNRFGDSLLHIAVNNNNYELSKLLIDKNIDVNIKNTLGETPLILALRNKNSEISELLICSNADISIKDQFELLPINYASLNNQFKILTILKSNDINKSCNKTSFIPQEEKKIVKSASSLGLNDKNDIDKYITDIFEKYMKYYDSQNKSFNLLDVRFTFDNGSTKLNDAQKIIFVDIFSKFAKLIDEHKNIKNIVITGYCSNSFRGSGDKKDIEEKNLQIGKQRAIHTKDYLQSIYEVDKDNKYKNLLDKIILDSKIDNTNNERLSRRVDFQIVLEEPVK